MFAARASTSRCFLLHQFKIHRAYVHPRNLATHIAVVGGGPAGFYTTGMLLKNPDVSVDIYEKLPVPFGLVRYGVAPDHADVKNCIKALTKIGNEDRVKFVGNVSVGQDISLEQLIEAYHAVVLSYGSAKDRLLGIDGELTTKNTVSSREFVGWYNGLPENKDLDVDLSCDTACIIGHGNVALDCARILANPANLDKTDITSYAQDKLSRSNIRKIYIVGRRGPLQVSFTTRELRELVKLSNVHARLEPHDIFGEVNTTFKSKLSVPQTKKRITQLLMDLSARDTGPSTKCGNMIDVVFKFFSKPREIIADQESKQVKCLHVQKTSYDDSSQFLDPEARPNDCKDSEMINCGLIIRSVGFQAIPIDKCLPYNHKRGCILNTNGRIHGHKSVYCSGWLATGATGVLAGTIQSSKVTTTSILEDIQNGNLQNLNRIKQGRKEITQLLDSKDVPYITFKDWSRIDELERRLGEASGKTREKLVDVEEMIKIALYGKNNQE